MDKTTKLNTNKKQIQGSTNYVAPKPLTAADIARAEAEELLHGVPWLREKADRINAGTRSLLLDTLDSIDKEMAALAMIEHCVDSLVNDAANEKDLEVKISFDELGEIGVALMLAKQNIERHISVAAESLKKTS